MLRRACPLTTGTLWRACERTVPLSDSHSVASAKFGAILGMGPGGVAVYSSDYPSVDRAELPTRQAFRSYVDGIYMGQK